MANGGVIVLGPFRISGWAAKIEHQFGIFALDTEGGIEPFLFLSLVVPEGADGNTVGTDLANDG